MGDELREAALSYARRGWRVFPLQPKSKDPWPGSRGLLDATTDEERVAAWWAKAPSANIGLATGGAFGVVLDVDDMALLPALGELPATREIKTARGVHLVFKSRPIGNSRGGLPKGVDVRGAGTGYVVAPPSVHPSGHVYAWGGASDAADMPLHIAAQLRPKVAVDEAVLDRFSGPEDEVNVPIAAMRLLRDALDDAASATERRGTATFGAAARVGALVAAGEVGVELAERMLMEAAQDSGLVDDDGEDKVRREVRRGLAAGADRETERAELRQAVERAVEAREVRSAPVTRAVDRSPLLIGSDVEISARVLGGLEAGEKLVYDLDKLHAYQDESGVWGEVSKHVVAQQTMALDGIKFPLDSGKFGTIRLGQARISSIYSCACSARAQEGFFANAPEGVAFRNGRVVVDERGVRLEPHGPDARQQFALPFDWDPAARAEAVDRVLADAFEADEATAAMVYDFLGVCLVGGAPRLERAMLFVGRGGDGKSTILDAVSALFPAEAQCSISPQLFSVDSKRAELAGKRLNVVSEVPESEIRHPESWRAFISGDRVTARRPYGMEFTFRPSAGHLYSANTLPTTQDFTDAFWRRWLVVPFTQVPEERRDPAVKAQALRELQGLAARLIEGAARVAARGWRLAVSERCERAVKAWREENDSVLQWLAETQTDWDRGTTKAFAAIFEAYSSYARIQELGALSAKAFSARLRALGFEPVRMGKSSTKGFTR